MAIKTVYPVVGMVHGNGKYFRVASGLFVRVRDVGRAEIINVEGYMFNPVIVKSLKMLTGRKIHEENFRDL